MIDPQRVFFFKLLMLEIFTKKKCDKDKKNHNNNPPYRVLQFITDHPKDIATSTSARFFASNAY